MDKLYFTAPSGNAPQKIRGLLSEMTNLAFAVQDDEIPSSNLVQFVEQLKQTGHYQQRSTSFQSVLESDLLSACSYWEEQYRYDVCWPVIALHCFSNKIN